MKKYKGIITLNKNNRGCYILDTVKGCSGGRTYNNRGCYGDCYAKKIADRYGFDFLDTRKREFNNKSDQLYFFGFSDLTHTNNIIHQIKDIEMPFVRIGEMGDPSESWEHTLEICTAISKTNKPIVIVTKHWKKIPDKLLKIVEELRLCINTSVSALDENDELRYRLNQFNRLKSVCNSVLRIVSCDFNKNNEDGFNLSKIQNELFKYDKHIDTIFRRSKDNPFVLSGVIKTEKVKFLNSLVLVSVFNKNTYFGKCNNCPDMCGIKK